MSHSGDQCSTDHKHAVRGTEVFVGGLARSTTEEKIREVFSSCGEIMEMRLIKDQKGNSKGFCFIRFGIKEAADRAVKDKSGTLIDGKKIGVLPSTEQDSLYLGNLRKDWSADEFDKIVRQAFPDVVSVNLAMPFGGENHLGQKLQNRGFAIVKFSSHAAAARAYRLGSKSDFVLAANCHPAVDWAQDEPEIDPEELAKIKIAFVRNLPQDFEENYLQKLFEPLGELEKVVISKKGRSPVGFVHFANRSDLENAIKEMNGKAVQGPSGGPSFNLMVEIARPIEKNRKRTREDPQSKLASKITSHPKISKGEQILNASGRLKSGSQQLKNSLEEPVVSDPYEAAVVSLPVAVKERLLRILRLGIATRFDIDIRCLTSLKELPESAAISILDQFMLSGADRQDKGAYLAGLISRHQVDKLGLGQYTSNLSRIGDITSKESQLAGYSRRVHLPAMGPLASSVDTTMSRYDIYTSRYPSSLLTQPLSSRASFGIEESGLASAATLYRTPAPSASYAKVGLGSPLVATAADRELPRPQVKFDPFTGEPYKFDPFTGEPIRSENNLSRHYGSPY
ncbi:polyadenylate-binding protein, cytoplasmic and nuclear-like isoform X2 [Diospyros lotus]|nr:polyadenylate-binding protein, cytoplasmic and nuclear-like isoform X2 [Diospyros lotus]